mgnify:CR=1 FL=1
MKVFIFYLQLLLLSWVAAIVANESPNWVKIAPNKVISSWDLSFAIKHAREETKVTNSHGFNKTTS